MVLIILVHICKTTSMTSKTLIHIHNYKSFIVHYNKTPKDVNVLF